jgi:DNA-binding response OmpR family regulator
MALPPVASLHVLIIHRPDATEAYATYLRGEGFVVSEATDSADGIAKALALAPDFIILDFALDGETTSRLKAHITTRAIPVIALAKMDEIRREGSV